MTARTTLRDEEARVRDAVEALVTDEGFDLVAVQLLVLGGRRTLRLSIDRPGGVTIDHCTSVSHLMSPVLDVSDMVAGAYDLEVSSPGMDRPLQRLQDFEKFKGYKAKIRTSSGARQRYTGTLAGVEGQEVLVEASGQVHRLAFLDIERASLVLTLDEYRSISGLEKEDSDS